MSFGPSSATGSTGHFVRTLPTKPLSDLDSVTTSTQGGISSRGSLGNLLFEGVASTVGPGAPPRD